MPSKYSFAISSFFDRIPWFIGGEYAQNILAQVNDFGESGELPVRFQPTIIARAPPSGKYTEQSSLFYTQSQR